MKKQKSVWIVLLLAMSLAGCSKKDKVPPEIIGENKMGQILLDMQEAEAYNDSYIDSAFRATDRETRLKIFYAQILMIHQVSKEEFLSSYSFYESRPDLMQKIYTRMQAEIDRKKAHADSLANLEEQKSAAARRRGQLIKKFKSYQLPYQRYGDSMTSPATKVPRPEAPKPLKKVP